MFKAGEVMIIFETTGGREHKITIPGQVEAFERVMFNYGHAIIDRNFDALASLKFFANNRWYMASHVICWELIPVKKLKRVPLYGRRGIAFEGIKGKPAKL
jgi:hypothetical protein